MAFAQTPRNGRLGKWPKSNRNRRLLKRLLRVLGGEGEGICGRKSGHNATALNHSILAIRDENTTE